MHDLMREGRGTPALYLYMECGAKTRRFGSEAFLQETPFTLILVEFDGVYNLFMSRLIGFEPNLARKGVPVRAKFVRNCKFMPTEASFVPE